MLEENLASPALHTSAYGSIRQHTLEEKLASPALHSAAYVSIREHTSAYVGREPRLACAAINPNARQYGMTLLAVAVE